MAEETDKEKDEQPAEEPAESTEAGRAPQSEEELRAQLEEELRKVRVEDVLLQSVASLINLSARRIAKEDERDLGQAKVGIDAVRAVVDLLPDEAATQVRSALSELQVLYAKHAGDQGPGEGGSDEKKAGDAAREQAAESAPKHKPDSRIWTPPGT